MSIGSFARPNSKAPFAKFYGECAGKCRAPATAEHARWQRSRAPGFRLSEPGRLFLAEAVNNPHGSAVIPLAGASVAAGINLVEVGVLVIELDQANRPALLEFHVEAAAAHPGRRPSPMTVGIETALA